MSAATKLLAKGRCQVRGRDRMLGQIDPGISEILSSASETRNFIPDLKPLSHCLSIVRRFESVPPRSKVVTNRAESSQKSLHLSC